MTVVWALYATRTRAALYWSAVRIWVVLAAIAVALAGWASGPRGALTCGVVALVILALVIWLPRAAHRAFGAGRFERARMLCLLAGFSRLSRRALLSARLSANACTLGAGKLDKGLATAEALTDCNFATDQRAVWQNNLAYVLARKGLRVGEAITLAEKALTLRPNQPGFVHTRGIALLAAGRVDEAIASLETVYSANSSDDAKRDSKALEAERCFDIARAWLAKGEQAYACDYFDRSRLAAPQSRWAELAAKELSARGGPTTAVPTDGIV